MTKHDFMGRVIHETSNAYLVDTPKREFWLTKRFILNQEEVDSSNRESYMLFTIPKWLAEENGIA